MKAITNTTISLGLVNLPVGICKATGEVADVKFNLGDEQGRKLTQQYINPEGTVVASDDQTRTLDGHIIDRDDIAAITANTKIEGLTVSKTEPRAKFDRESHRITGSYFIQSQAKGGNVNALKLFTDALTETGMVAVTKIMLRSRQYQFVIWPDEDGMLRGSTMVFASDCRNPDEGVRAHLAGAYKPAELDMAKQLLAAYSDDSIDPLMDDVDEAIALRHELVAKVQDGESIEAPTDVPAPEKNAALADALAASLAAIKGNKVAA